MPLVDLDAIPQVPLDFINADHREEARLLNELDEAVAGAPRRPHRPRRRWWPASRSSSSTPASTSGARRRPCGSVGFPPYPVHQGEHERVLAELAAEGQAFAAGHDADRLAEYVGKAVPAWFTNHILTMDLMTARFVQMRGG